MKSPKWRMPCSRVLLPAPEGAEITNRRPLRRYSKGRSVGVLTGLFDILDLLSDFLQLRLSSDHPMGNRCVVGLYSKSIELARDFLS